MEYLARIMRIFPDVPYLLEGSFFLLGVLLSSLIWYTFFLRRWKNVRRTREFIRMENLRRSEELEAQRK
jgi:hypothetical protein